MVMEMTAWRRVLLMTTLVLTNVTCFGATPWLPFGPDGGDARKITADPGNAAHLFLGTVNGWIYESRNGGGNWLRVTRVGNRDDLVIDCIVVDPRNPKHLIVGAYAVDQPDGGVYLSNDGGVSWVNQAEMRGQSVRSLAMSASDPNTLVAGSLQGVFRSDDGGQRWKRISPIDNVEIHEVKSVAIDPTDTKVIYAGTWHLPWKTSDGGEHWENIKDGIIDDSDVFSIIVDPKNPATVYASACSGIYKSINAGVHFEKVQGIPSTSRRTRVLMQDPTRLAVVFAGTTEGLFRSEDAGKTWTAKTGPEIIVNDVMVDATDSSRILIAIDRGGVMASDDGGDTFHPTNGGFSARQITTLKRDAGHPARLYVGVVNDKEWGGVFRSDNGGLNWVQTSEGLQGRDVFSLGQAQDGTMIAGTAHGIYRLAGEDGGWKRVEDAPGTAPTVAAGGPAKQVAVVIRPPVPIGRNHFAERHAALLSPRQRRLAALSIKSKGRKRPLPQRRAQVSAASRRKGPNGKRLVTTTRTGKAKPKVLTPAPVQLAVASPPTPTPTPAPATPGFDGSVYMLTTAQDQMLATTSEGMLISADNGLTWKAGGPKGSSDLHFLASAKANVVAASAQKLQFSSDAGANWVQLPLPELLSRVAALAVDSSGTVWVGGREGVFVSSDGGQTWLTPKNLYVNSVSSLFYDEGTDRMTLTTGGLDSYNGIVFAVQLPQRTVTYANAGWTLRFAKPVGDHLVAATLFDGIVVQPKMIASPVTAAGASTR